MLSYIQKKTLFDLCAVLRIGKRMNDEEKKQYGLRHHLADLQIDLDKANIGSALINEATKLSMETDMYINDIIRMIDKGEN
jgi:hypothetical protein